MLVFAELFGQVMNIVFMCYMFWFPEILVILFDPVE